MSLTIILIENIVFYRMQVTLPRHVEGWYVQIDRYTDYVTTKIDR